MAGSLTTYVYDNENRLTSIQFPAGTRSTYSYDGYGLRRTAFEAGGVLTTHIWDGQDYLGEYGGSGGVRQVAASLHLDKEREY